jgi:plasmid stability protein
MANLSVRNVPDRVVNDLKRRARRNGRSLEAEVRAILEENTRITPEEFWRMADESREAKRGRWTGDSTQMIREDRDR